MGHSHNDHHHDNHDHDSHQRSDVLKRLKIASVLCTTFLIVEVIGGWLSGSLAILSDAAHLLADLAAFCVAIAASYLASLPSTSQHTFGLKRTESLAALFSMVSLALVSVGLAVEAVRRLYILLVFRRSDELVDGKLMSLIATIGVIVNVVLAFVLGEHHVHLPGFDDGHDHGHGHDHHGSCSSTGHDDNINHHSHEHNSIAHDDHDHSHEHNNNAHNSHDHDEEAVELLHTNSTASSAYGGIEGKLSIEHNDELVPSSHNSEVTQRMRNVNLHAAYIHVLSDLIQSVAVLIAGLVMWIRPTWQVVDPICTLIFCAIVFYSTLGVLRSSISVLLEEVPPNLHWQEVHDQLSAVEGVTNVHHLHIWSISQGVPTLSVHAMVTNNHQEQALRDMYEVCSGFGIRHATIQVQPVTMGDDCVTCCPRQKAMCH